MSSGGTRSSSGVSFEIKQLKENLSKASDDKERCMDILQRLEELPMTLQLLSATLIGTVVSKLKSHKDGAVASKAKALVKKWKKLAKEGGVGGGASVSSNKSEKRPSLKKSLSSGSTASTASLKSTAGSGAPAGAPEAPKEWDKLPPLRKNICTKLHNIFMTSPASVLDSAPELKDQSLAAVSAQRAAAVELAIQNFSKGAKASYTDKARTLFFNLKKNAPLRENILLGHTTAAQLVAMSPEQLATNEKAKARNEAASALNDSRLLDWEQKNESKINEMCGIKGELLKASLFTCGRCKSTKTTSTQKQTRSADEPMTVFVFCTNCGNRWKC